MYKSQVNNKCHCFLLLFIPPSVICLSLFSCVHLHHSKSTCKGPILCFLTVLNRAKCFTNPDSRVNEGNGRCERERERESWDLVICTLTEVHLLGQCSFGDFRFYSLLKFVSSSLQLTWPSLSQFLFLFSSLSFHQSKYFTPPFAIESAVTGHVGSLFDCRNVI